MHTPKISLIFWVRFYNKNHKIVEVTNSYHKSKSIHTLIFIPYFVKEGKISLLPTQHMYMYIWLKKETTIIILKIGIRINLKIMIINH